RRLAEQQAYLLRQRSVQIHDVRPPFETPDQLCRGRDADVAGDQRLLEPFPRRGIAGIERRGGELLGKGAPRARERIPQATEEAGALLVLSTSCRVVAEQLS